jgi:hypothetical protein
MQAVIGSHMNTMGADIVVRPGAPAGSQQTQKPIAEIALAHNGVVGSLVAEGQLRTGSRARIRATCTLGPALR